MPGGPELLGCGPHVGEADFASLGESAVVVGLLDRLGNLLWVLALDSQVGSQLVIGQDGFDRPRIEADRRSCARIVSYRAYRRGGKGRGSRESAHDEAHEAVVTFIGDFEAARGENFDGGAAGNVGRGGAFCQGNFGIPGHHVGAQRRIFHPLHLLGMRREGCGCASHNRQSQSCQVHGSCSCWSTRVG